jgi:hypothetical protein
MRALVLALAVVDVAGWVVAGGGSLEELVQRRTSLWGMTALGQRAIAGMRVLFDGKSLLCFDYSSRAVNKECGFAGAMLATGE